MHGQSQISSEKKAHQVPASYIHYTHLLAENFESKLRIDGYATLPSHYQRSDEWQTSRTSSVISRIAAV